METKILQGESPEERLKTLKENAERSEDFTYPKVLGGDEVTNLKDEITADFIELAKLDEAKKEFAANHKAKVKPLKQKVAGVLTKIRNRVEEVSEEVYLLADQEEGVMAYYNSRGELVHHRPLLANERQFRIVDNTGTNNN